MFVFSDFYLWISTLHTCARGRKHTELSNTTISRGFQAQKDLEALLSAPSHATSSRSHLSNLYYSYIPHYHGTMRLTDLFKSNIKYEVKLLETLRDLKDAQNIASRAKDSCSQVTLSHYLLAGSIM